MSNSIIKLSIVAFGVCEILQSIAKNTSRAIIIKERPQNNENQEPQFYEGNQFYDSLFSYLMYGEDVDGFKELHSELIKELNEKLPEATINLACEYCIVHANKISDPDEAKQLIEEYLNGREQ